MSIWRPRYNVGFPFSPLLIWVKVMVISDPNATKAAAAMSVDVGAASDPADLPGLAHFLEHMLFLGELELMACLEQVSKEVATW